MGGEQSKIDARPVTKEAAMYQSAEDFVSKVVIGQNAPNGSAFTLDGVETMLLKSIDPARITILNFGSCT